MFVCLVPKISQVMIKWRRRASHLGRFTLWHNGRRTKPGLMHAPGVADIFQSQWRTMLKNMKALSKVKFDSKLLKDDTQHKLGVAFSYIERNYFAGLKFRDFHVSPFFKVIKFRGARVLNFHFFILFNHNGIETQPATGWNVQQFQQHNVFLKVHWYKQPRHYSTHWPFRLGSAQCFQMDLQAIKLSNLEQVRIFALCSSLLQRAAFPH